MSAKSKSSNHSSVHSSDRRRQEERDDVLRAAQCLFEISRQGSTGTVGGRPAAGMASNANSHKRQGNKDESPGRTTGKNVRRKTCSKCLRTFDTEGKKDEHGRSCEKRHKCNQCPYETPFFSHYERHKLTHAERKCPNCPKTFFSRKSLFGHVQAKHKGQSEPSSFACNECGNRYNMQKSLQRHIREKHLVGTEQFRCQHCGRNFISAKGLEVHMAASHRGMATKKTIRCEICGTEFSRTHSLARHMRNVHQM